MAPIAPTAGVKSSIRHSKVVRTHQSLFEYLDADRSTLRLVCYCAGPTFLMSMMYTFTGRLSLALGQQAIQPRSILVEQTSSLFSSRYVVASMLKSMYANGGLRVGIHRQWVRSGWSADNNYRQYVGASISKRTTPSSFVFGISA